MFDFVDVVNSFKICTFWGLSSKNSDVTKNGFLFGKDLSTTHFSQ